MSLNVTPKIYINEKRDNKYDLDILSYCFNEAKNVNLKLKLSTYFRKNVIEPLVKDNYLIKKNISKKRISLFFK